MKVWEYESNEDDKLAKQVEKDNDIVMTKPEMSIHLLSLIEFKEGDILLEPCKGKGAFYNNFPDYTINKYCEINEGIDFLDYDENDKVDYVLSNPPFVPRKLFWSFQQKAMKVSKKEIYWLINMSALNVFTPKRLKEMSEEGWYINSFHIVSDKRWYGRYVWVKISKHDNNFISFKNGSF